MSEPEQRTITFGRLTMDGEPLVPEGSWVLAETHGADTTSFIALNTAEAQLLGARITQELGGPGDRRTAEDAIMTWLDETVGVSVSEHVLRGDADKLLDQLGWLEPPTEY